MSVNMDNGRWVIGVTPHRVHRRVVVEGAGNGIAAVALHARHLGPRHVHVTIMFQVTVGTDLARAVVGHVVVGVGLELRASDSASAGADAEEASGALGILAVKSEGARQRILVAEETAAGTEAGTIVFGCQRRPGQNQC